MRLFQKALTWFGVVTILSGEIAYAQTCASPPGDLVSWWQGENNALDIVGGNNGTLHGNITYGPGEVGTAFSSDGVDGTGVLIGNPANLQLQTFTIEAWIQRSNPTMISASGSSSGLVFSYGSAGYGVGLLDDGTPFLTTIDIANVQGGQKISDTAFHHLAVTKDDTNVVIYVDGVATLTTNYTSVFQFFTSAAIGARGDNFQSSFLGTIDEVSVYNRALLASEIQSIYNAGAAGKCTGPVVPSITSFQPATQTALAGENTNLTVIAAGSPPLNYIWLFNGTNLEESTDSFLPLVNIQAANAGNYQVIVTNTFGSATSAVSTLSVLIPPVFNQQPASQLSPANGTVVFTVAVAGTGPLSYQWLFNSNSLPGQTNYLLELTNVQATNGGAYTVVVTNFLGSITSAPATLTLLLPPVIVAQPQSQTNVIGSNAHFSVVATNPIGLFYQWKFTGTNLATVNVSGATNSTFQLNDVQFGNAGSYFVVVSNLAGVATSSNALLTLVPPICSPAPSNLVAWWQGNGDARDAISGSNGTLMGGVTFAAGEVGQAFSLDGNFGSAVAVGNSTNWQLQDFTIEAWVRRADTNLISYPGSGSGVIFSYGSEGYGLGMLDDGTPFLSTIDEANVEGGQKISDTAFHHLAVTKGGTNVVIYIDGVATLTTNYTSGFQFYTDAAIGARGDDFDSVFLGVIDEVSLYNRPIEASEIQSIYNATSLGKCALPISFLTQPASQSVTVGSNATFNVNFAGSGPVTFQWFLNGQAIAGATNSTLALNELTFFQAGNYSVTANNGAGPVTLSNFVVNVQARPLLVNGGFETGDFTGWVVTNLAFSTYPLAVLPAGFDPGFGFFLTAPTEGAFAATHSFDGAGPGTISVAQDVLLPLGPARLTFDYRAAWDMLDYGGSTLPRTFDVTLQPYGGGTPLLTTNFLTAPPGTANFDTGPLSGSLDVTAYSGRGLRISFDAGIPEFFTGPGFFQLDNVVLGYSILPILAITPSGTNITVSWLASPTNYSLLESADLRTSNAWSVVNSNLMSHGITNTSVTLPRSPTPTYYRLRYP